MPRKKAIDWRKLPRKPAASKRSEQIAIRVTPSEHAAITAAARAAELTLRDYMVARCLTEPPQVQ